MTDDHPVVVPPEPPERTPLYRRKWFIALVGVILLLFLIGTCGDDAETGASTTTTVESSTTSSDPTTTVAPATTAAPVTTATPTTTIDQIDPQFASCEEATNAGYGPYEADDPEFGWYTDGDGDGIVCETE